MPAFFIDLTEITVNNPVRDCDDSCQFSRRSGFRFNLVPRTSLAFKSTLTEAKKEPGYEVSHRTIRGIIRALPRENSRKNARD